jgi:hypothetical protein
VAAFDELLDRLEELLSRMDELDEPTRGEVFELLDGFDAVHRMALEHLADRLGQNELSELRTDPVLAWLLDAYGLGPQPDSGAQADRPSGPARGAEPGPGATVLPLHPGSGDTR